MGIEKIAKIIYAEIIEGLIFYVILLVVGALPSSSMFNPVTAVLTIWSIFGVATPVIIWFELEEEISKIFLYFMLNNDSRWSKKVRQWEEIRALSLDRQGGNTF